jgi:putative Mg2+ transporter-C (MgtC) family protein
MIAMVEFPEFILRTLFAGACGLVVGIDREIKDKPLGAHAYILVALGSAALMVVTLNFSLSSMANDGDMTIDPTRLIQGIVGGIGFLGAGAIMTSDDSHRLRGVGSGAAIWGAGAIGVACGLGYLKEAAFLAGITFLILNLHDGFERYAKAKHPKDEG